MKPRAAMRAAQAALCCAAAALLGGCATTTKSYDYTAFEQSRPKSILVLPPVNDSNSVEAAYSVFSQLTLPLAESGYYVLPVTLVEETFRQNGMNAPADAAAVPAEKLHEIFGADAALYVTIKEYGTVYAVISSASVVAAEARLVDLRSGVLLWEGAARASSDESRNYNNSGGVVGLLVMAVVQQIIEDVSDTSHKVAGVTSARLLTAGTPGGLLYGPRSPKFQSP